MTAVAPPPAAPPPVPPPPTALTAVVVNGQASLAQAAIGQRIDGRVLANTTDGTVRIRLTTGIIEIQAPMAMSKGANVTLLLQSLAPRVQVQILAIDGRAPPATGRTVAGPATPSPPSAPPAPPTTPPTTPSTTSGHTPPPAAVRGPPLVPGATVAATVLRPAATPLQTAAQPPSTAYGSTGSVANAANPLAAPAGTRFSVRILEVQVAGPDGRPSAPMGSAVTQPASGGIRVTGTLTAFSPEGHAVIRIGQGALTLAVEGAPPRGTAVALEILGSTADQPAARSVASLQSLGDPFVTRGQSWPALEESLRVLAQADPSLARHLGETVMPRLDARLTATILSFLTALRGGDVRGWLGDAAARTLERESPRLLGRLAEEFRRLGIPGDEPSSTDWRTVPIPLETGGQISWARLFRRDGNLQDDEDSVATRFVVEVKLSRLGRTQLDGLVSDAGRTLDLIVRTETAMTREMREDIRAIFRDASLTTGISGGVTFRTSPPDFIEVEGRPDAHRDVVV